MAEQWGYVPCTNEDTEKARVTTSYIVKGKSQ